MVLIADAEDPVATDDLAAVSGELELRGLAFRSVAVNGLEGATEAARETLASGDRFMVAVGGDPLIGAVANGMLETEAPTRGVLGVVAGRAPSDLIRTFGLPADPSRACGHLEGDNVMPIDAVRLTCWAPGGAHAEGSFLNLAEVGLGGSVARWTSRLPRGLGRLRRFLGFWVAVATFRPATVDLRGDRRSWQGRAHGVVVANGQYAGEGYRLSPRSWPGDGYVDVLVMKGPKSDAFTILNKAVLGEHLPNPNIVEYRSRTLSIEPERPWQIVADGRVIGTTPATFEVIPEAIRLKI